MYSQRGPQTERIIIKSLVTVCPKGVTVGQTRLHPWLQFSEGGADWLKELLPYILGYSIPERGYS
jgi:hypothetical protein